MADLNPALPTLNTDCLGITFTAFATTQLGIEPATYQSQDAPRDTFTPLD